jgi:hypothetical protein
MMTFLWISVKNTFTVMNSSKPIIQIVFYQPKNSNRAELSENFYTNKINVQITFNCTFIIIHILKRESDPHQIYDCLKQLI